MLIEADPGRSAASAPPPPSARTPLTAAAAPGAAPPLALQPNPHTEYDPKLGLVLLEFRDPATQAITSYPDPQHLPPETGTVHDMTA